MATHPEHERHGDAPAAPGAGSDPAAAVGPARQPRRRRFGVALSAALIVVAGGVAAALVPTVPASSHAVPVATGGSGWPDSGSLPELVVDPRPVSASELAALPPATTATTVPAAPPDTDRDTAPSGRIVHPSTTVAVYRAPGGEAIASLTSTQLGADTWVPVIDEQPGWVRVMLPVRPAGASGWLYLDDPRITLARTPYRIVVDRAAFTLTLLDEGRPVGQWTVGVGKATSVTPPGRTFILASIQDDHPTYSPVILPLGTHSATYTTYGGGPGTVGIHTWPNSTVYGTQSSDGCVRVPPDALDLLSTQVPIGTPVLIR